MTACIAQRFCGRLKVIAASTARMAMLHVRQFRKQRNVARLTDAVRASQRVGEKHRLCDKPPELVEKGTAARNGLAEPQENVSVSVISHLPNVDFYSCAHRA